MNVCFISSLQFFISAEMGDRRMDSYFLQEVESFWSAIRVVDLLWTVHFNVICWVADSVYGPIKL